MTTPKSYEKGTFYEFSITCDLNEVMLQVDLSDGSTLGIYTYSKERPYLVVPNVKGDGFKDWNPGWRQGKNKLFAHMPEKSWQTFAENTVENECILSDDLDDLVESGELPDTIFQNPVIAALRDR